MPTRVRRPQPGDAFVTAFAQAAAYACVYELKARLVAGVVPVLQRASVPDELSKLVPKILQELGPLASARERLVIDACARIRNKLIHLELSRATGRLVPLAEHIRQAQPVVKVNLETGDIKKVRDTSTTEGGVYGWLLESGQSGAFAATAELFAEGIAALEDILDRWHAQPTGLAPGTSGTNDAP